jgi:hypothetical protein
MSDKKISQLTNATTPLAGSEVFPIVQSGSTVKTSIDLMLASGRPASFGNLAYTGTLTGGTGILNIGSGQVYKDASGNFGIGTNAPSTNFEVRNATAATVRIRSLSSTASNAPKLNFFHDGNDLFTIEGGARLKFLGSGSVELMDVDTATSNVKVTAGNLIIGTSGKGIDFSATPGTGTSELLADYEEGTWTPADGSGAGLVFTVAYATYTKIGRQVSFVANITYPSTVDATAASIQGFPFAATNAIFGNVSYTTEPAASLLYFSGNTTKLFLLVPGVNTTNAQMSGEALLFSGTYFI